MSLTQARLVGGPASERNDGLAPQDLKCPVCAEVLRNPYVTACGHSACYNCIRNHLNIKRTCPTCAAFLTEDQVYPNFLLSKLLTKAGATMSGSGRSASLLDTVRSVVSQDRQLNSAEIQAIIRVLTEKNQQLQEEEGLESLELLLRFLRQAKAHQQQKLHQHNLQLESVGVDLTQARARMGRPPPRSNPSYTRLAAFEEGAATSRHLVTIKTEAGLVPNLPPPMPIYPPTSAVPSYPPTSLPTAHVPAMDAMPTTCALDASKGGTAKHPSCLGTKRPFHAIRDSAWESAGAGPTSLAGLGTAAGPTSLAGLGTAAGPTSLTGLGAGPGPTSLPGLGAAASDAAAAPGPGSLLGLGGLGGWGGAGGGGGGGGCSMLEGVGSVALEPPRKAPTLPSGARGQSLPGLPRLAPHFGELQNRYLQNRTRVVDAPQCSTNISESVHDQGGEALGPGPGPSGAASPAFSPNGYREGEAEGPGMSMEELSRMLNAAGRFSRARLLTVLRCKSSRIGNVLSSIEFDKEGQLIATAGVMRAINIFNLSNVLRSPSSKHLPSSEMRSRSKLSCLSWSQGQQQHLISSDYDGTVILWDAQEAESVQEWEAHDKHIWSVDFSTVEPTRFASGSDDASVKVWSTTQEACCLTVPLGANVCSVKWHPSSPHQLLVGSAAHSVYLYDIRSPLEPLQTLTGHTKAVSYARFLSADEVVSASIDSSLRLWNLQGGGCSRVFNGHMNEKNFVGLCTEGEYMLTGSETNEVFLYCSSMAKPVLSYSLEETNEAADVMPFVTAVAWRPGTSTVLTANSSGNTWILELCN